MRTAPARAVAWDPPDDADSHGDVSEYADITRAEVRGGDAAALSVILTGAVPAATEDDDTFATIGFRLRPPRGPEAYVYADGDSQGWRGYVQRGEAHARLPTSALAIRGRMLSLRVPWRALGNPRSFSWYADLAWVRGTILDTHYALDSAPTNYWESFRR